MSAISPAGRGANGAARGQKVGQRRFSVSRGGMHFDNLARRTRRVFLRPMPRPFGALPLCPVSATCHPPGFPHVEASMATYDFIVSGVGPEMALQGAATTDAEAWREAILFLSEMLRDEPVQGDGAFSLQVIVRNEGREICRVSASAH